MSGVWTATLPWLLAGLGMVLALALLRRPLGSLLRLIGRTGLGLCFLTLFAPVGQFLGAGLGINLFNALTLGLLGAPGFGLLLMLHWVLR